MLSGVWKRRGHSYRRAHRSFPFVAFLRSVDLQGAVAIHVREASEVTILIRGVHDTVGTSAVAGARVGRHRPLVRQSDGLYRDDSVSLSLCRALSVSLSPPLSILPTPLSRPLSLCLRGRLILHTCPDRSREAEPPKGGVVFKHVFKAAIDLDRQLTAQSQHAFARGNTMKERKNPISTDVRELQHTTRTPLLLSTLARDVRCTSLQSGGAQPRPIKNQASRNKCEASYPSIL